jgi:hypothetical protein
VIEGNGAWTGGGFVIEGSFRRNTIYYNGAFQSGTPQAGAVRGEVLHNWFDNSCGSDEPYLLVEGPARVGYNRFNDLIWDLCYWYATVHLRGSIEFYHNTLANVVVQACLATQMSQSSPGYFRMWNNIVDGWAQLHTNPTGYFCYYYGGADPLVPIPADSIALYCNLRTHSAMELDGESCGSCSFQGDPKFCELPSWVEDYYYEGWFDLRLNTLSEALPENSPVGCRDTLGAMGIGCGPNPVRLLSYGVESENGAVRLFWRLPLDVMVGGFHIDREADGSRERITEEPVTSCRDCEFVDPSPPLAERLAYHLIILLPGQDEEFFLGEVRRESLEPSNLVLRTPSPHPVRGVASLAFGVPHPGGDVRLELFDLAGRRVASLQDGSIPSGWHRIAWNPRDVEGRNLPCGLYVLRLATEQAEVTGKFLILR